MVYEPKNFTPTTEAEFVLEEYLPESNLELIFDCLKEGIVMLNATV